MRKLCVKKYEQMIHKPSMASGTATLAFLTDFHNGKPSVAASVLQTLDEIQPDMVCIGGDMLVGKPDQPFTPALDLVREISIRYPVVYAYGNHEYRMCIYPETYKHAGEAYEEELKKLPLTLLRNTSAEVTLKGMRFRFSGLEIPARNYKKWKKTLFSVEDMTKRIGSPKAEMIDVLLAHNPVFSDTYFAWGADMILSGHMHGGIVRVFGRPVIGTDGKLFPKYGYGRMDKKDASLFVSAGLGEHTIPLRLFNPRELVIVTVTNEI